MKRICISLLLSFLLAAGCLPTVSAHAGSTEVVAVIPTPTGTGIPGTPTPTGAEVTATPMPAATPTGAGIPGTPTPTGAGATASPTPLLTPTGFPAVPTAKPTGMDIPQTGDESHGAEFLLLTAASLAVIFSILFSGKREKR